MSIFLTELSARHALLTKQKVFRAEGQRLQSNATKMTGTSEVPIQVPDEPTTAPVIVREKSDEAEGKVDLADIPAAEDAAGDERDRGTSREKRRRRSSDGLFVSDDEEEGGFQTQRTPASKRKKRDGEGNPTGWQKVDVEDDKKKMGLNTSYEGFSIYGRILCLVVKRRGVVRGKQAASGAGQAMMEGWIASTQVDRDEED